MDNVDCCNLALSRIGHGTLRPISALTDNTEHAQACARVFPRILAMVLEEYVWPFARTCKALAATTADAPSGWSYAYAVPSDARSVLYVEGEDFIPEWLPLSESRSRWEIHADPATSGQLIVSDVPDAWAYYIRDVTQLQFTPELFGDLVAWRLAAEVGLGLKADAKLCQNAMQFYTQALDVAVSKAANQHGGRPRMQAESVIARGAGNADSLSGLRVAP
jgi:hypothetical protein